MQYVMVNKSHSEPLAIVVATNKPTGKEAAE